MQKATKIGSDKEILLSIGEASEYLGVSIDTLRRWEKKDKITALRSPGGHRYFKQKDLDNLFGRKYERKEEIKPRQVSEKKEEDKQKDIPKTSFSSYEIFDRQPRPVTIPQASPVKVIQDQPGPFQTQSEAFTATQAQPPSQINSSVLTPPVVTVKPQPAPISSVPPASQAKPQAKKSNSWIYFLIGFILLIVGFVIFIIFSSPSEVISPVP